MDFRREDLFLWITPVLAALSMEDMAFFMAVTASDFLPSLISFLTSLTTSALKLSFLAVFLTFLRIRLSHGLTGTLGIWHI